MRLIKLIKSGCLVFAVVLASWAHAATVDGLYEIRVPVVTQSEAEREEALKRALGGVLVRVTGNRLVEASPAGEKLVALAGRFLRQYRYEPLPSGKTLENRQPAPSQLLYAKFDEPAINEAIWKENLTVWGKTRPALVVWLGVQELESRVLVEDGDASQSAQAVKDQARSRGIPVVMPLIDAEDLANLPIDDVWNESLDKIRHASARYPAEAILAGHINQAADGSWIARFLFFLGDEPKVWDVSALDLPAVVSLGMDAAADEIAARYAPAVGNGAASELVLRVGDVRTIDDYARTQRYLASLPGVNSVQVLRVDAARVVLRIALRAGKSAFEQAVALGGQLLPDRVDGSDLPSSLVYRLRP